MRRHYCFRMAFILVSMLASWQTGWAQATDPPDTLAPAIDQFLASRPVDNNKRPLVGSGRDFVQWGGEFEVNPRLIVAISGAESTFGAHICTNNNAWNWFWEGPCPKSPFDSWSSGIHTVTHFMRKSYILQGYNTIPLIGHRYCTEGCQYWEGNVTSTYEALRGDMSTLAWVPEATSAGTQPTAPPSPVPAPVPPEPTPPAPVGPAVLARIDSVTPARTTWAGKPTGGPTVALTASVSTGSLTSPTVRVSRVVDHSSTPIGPLTAAGTDANGNKLFKGEFSFTDPGLRAIQLRVEARGRVSGHTKSVSSDVVSVAIPAPRNVGLWLAGAAAGVLVLLLLIVIFLLLRRLRGKPQAKPEETPAARARTGT